ncbi:MAG TPA: nuclear transport factor 2 family protein [Gemmataceae bacterium]|nr:nuclear transport factor 2 family protein [Gemmataceae bacterium]
MKRLGVILLAAFAVVSGQQTRADDKGTGDVMKAEQAFNDALTKGDQKEFDSLTSDDYILTSSIGTIWDKQRNAQAIGQGDLKLDTINNEDAKVRIYGDTAVVTGLSKIKGKFKDHAIDDSYRWTRVWVQHNGKWVCVAEQLSRVIPPSDATKPKDK